MNSVQKIELDIRKKVIECCRELDIKYFIDGGTCLGAVRHKGFIPWDDDIDLGMTRDNYSRFLHEAPSWLEKHNLFLQEFTTEKTSPFTYIKVRQNRTKFVEYCNRNVKMHRGIYIDIFPFDEISPIPSEEVRQFKRIRFWTLLYTYHQTPDITQKPESIHLMMKFICRRIIHYAVQIVPIKYIYRKLNDALTMNYGNSQSISVTHWIHTRIIPASKKGTEDTTTLMFEGVEVQAMSDFDYYLTNLYGDYMTLPPENERIGHIPYIFSLGE